jgi:PKD repeat protein
MKFKCIVVVLIAFLVLGVLPLQFVQVFCQPIVDGYASSDNPHVNTIERLTDEGWKLVVNDTIAHDHDFSTTDDASDDFWMSVWQACDDAGNVYLAFLSNYQLFGVAVWLDFNGDGVFTVGSEPSPLYASLDTPDFPCLYNFTRGIGYTDPIAGASVAYGFDNTFIEIMVPKVEMEGDVNETVWDCMNWNYMVGVDANADGNFNLMLDWIATGWGSWCTFTGNREHEMWNGADWVPLQSWFACPCQPSERCQVTFLTQPAEDGFSINFLGATYKDGDVDIFINGSSSVTTTNCPEGWVFDHWEVSGEITVSNSTENPAYIKIKSSGTIKAVFYPATCQVTFLTDPASSSFNITFKGIAYYNGSTDTFECGTVGPIIANCPGGWVFDHWETTGYLQVSNTTENPTNVTMNCGSIKAVFRTTKCNVTFLTDPAGTGFYIKFQCNNYQNGTIGTFSYGTSGSAIANCPSNWVFDHWEATGNIQISSTTTNPTNVTINCGGTLKAVFRPSQCQVTFYTEPTCDYYYITFQCKNYYNGATDTFAFGTSGPATANCPSGWEFDHWEVTGNIQISNTMTNPTNITICCGGTLKAVFRAAGCRVTFLTDPVCTGFNIKFQCNTYNNGTMGTFNYGTSGLATANCPDGWIFDHWEATGNVQVSNTTKNPTDVTICCGGTLKAIFKPLACQVTFLTNPVCNYYYINFKCTNYHNGTTDTFAFGTSGLATANCQEGWVFDHWEVTGNIQISSTTTNPANVTICCGGTLKAVFKRPQCQVTFYTNPVCNHYYITFQCKNYHNGTTDTFNYGTSGLATANCPDGWEFDHWEVTGNVQVSNATANPTTVTICCGGTLKAVFRQALKPPNADFTWCPTTPKTCETVTFNASASTPNGGVIVSYEWNFGDGNVTAVNTPIVTHHYGSAGSYTVVLKVTDSEEKWDTETKIITVQSCCPHACFTGNHHSLMVTFNASSSYDPDGYIVSYRWDFGDGNTTTVAVPIVNHKYAKPGTYNVTLTVIDDEGLSASAKDSITIETFLGDLNIDGKVNIFDIYIMAKAFGTKPGDPRWNPIADLNNDGKVGIEDVYFIAKDYGKTLL